MAATLVPPSGSSRKHLEGARYASGGQAPPHGSSTRRSSLPWHGIAQSLVRYLIQRDTKAFIRFVET